MNTIQKKETERERERARERERNTFKPSRTAVLKCQAFPKLLIDAVRCTFSGSQRGGVRGGKERRTKRKKEKGSKLFS